LDLFLCDQDNFTALGARELAAWPVMAGLTHLVVNLDAASAAALVSSPHVAGLRDLCLTGSRLGYQGATALANSVHLGALARLNLRNTGIGPAGAVAIAGSASLAQLRCLLMEGNKVGKVGAAALRKQFGDRVKL